MSFKIVVNRLNKAALNFIHTNNFEEFLSKCGAYGFHNNVECVELSITLTKSPDAGKCYFSFTHKGATVLFFYHSRLGIIPLHMKIDGDNRVYLFMLFDFDEVSSLAESVLAELTYCMFSVCIFGYR